MQIGDTLDLSLPDQDGNVTTLAQFKRSPIVLFVYPRADTPGCITEACEFRDQDAKLRDAGAVLLGLSRDPVKSQKKFAVKFTLPYPLLCDPELTVLQQLDVVKAGSMYGKPVTRIERSTFIFDRDGKLAAEFRSIKPEGHAAEMLRVIQALP